MTYCKAVSKATAYEDQESYRYEKVWYTSLVLLPRFTVLLTAPLDISGGTMDDHDGEKEGVEPWERAIEAGDQAPGKREVEVASVVDLCNSH